MTIESADIDYDALRRLARALLGDPHAADDAVQDALVGAAIREQRDVAWIVTPRRLTGFVRNAARQILRGERRRHRREHVAARSERIAATDEIVARTFEQRRVLDEVLGLDPIYREAILLRYFEDLPPRRIAERLGVPVTTVRTRIERGRSKLAKRLDLHGGDDRTWRSALVPVVGVPLSRFDAGVGTGGVLLAAKAKGAVAAGIVMLVVLFALLTFRTRTPHAPEPGPLPTDQPSMATRSNEDDLPTWQAPKRVRRPSNMELPKRESERAVVDPEYAATFVVRDLETDELLPDVLAEAAALVDGERVTREAISDALGRVVLQDPGRIDAGTGNTIVFRKQGYRPARVEWKSVFERAPDANRPTPVRLERRPRLVIRVCDEVGAPVADARVIGWSGKDAECFDPRYTPFRSAVRSLSLGSATSDVAGEAILGVPTAEEAWFVLAESSRGIGFATGSAAPVHEGPVPIILRTKMRLLGRVVDADGFPVEGVRVEYGYDHQLRGGLPMALAERYTAMTAGDGRFELPPQPRPDDGQTQLVVWGRTWIGATANVLVPESGLVDDLEIVFTIPDRVLRVLVRDEAGDPIEGARVALAQVRPYDVTDAAGVATLHHYDDHEDRAIRVTATGYATFSEALDVVQDPFVVTLAKERVLEGRVVGARGEPLSAYLNAFVGVFADDERPTGVPAQARYMGSCVSHYDGTFRFDGLPEGPYTLEVRVAYDGGVERITRVVEDASEPLVSRCEVEPPGPLQRISGYVVGVDGGRIVPESVYLYSLEKKNSVLAPAALGASFVFDDIEAGRYRIVASHRGHVVSHRLVEVFEGEDVEGVRLEPAPTTRWSGRLVVVGDVPSETNVDLAGTRIEIEPVEFGDASFCSVDASGRFSFDELIPGRYTVSLRLGSKGTPCLLMTRVVEIPAIERHEFDLEVRLAGALIVVVHDERLASRAEFEDERSRFDAPDKQNATGTRIHVVCDDARFQSHGVFRGRNRFPHGLPDGDYTITVSHSKLGKQFATATIRAGETVTVWIEELQ